MAAKKDNSEQPPAEDNVDQIREILFGGQMRAFDKRFELMESRLAKATEALQKTTEKRFQDLERVAAGIREEAADQLAAETNSRELALNKFELAMAALRGEAESQATAMEKRISDELKALRGDFEARFKELSAALSKSDQRLDKVTDKLDGAKVARQDLAKLFRGLADSIHPEKAGRGK